MKNISTILLGIVTIAAVATMVVAGDRQETKRMELANQKEKVCVSAVDKAYPDPNDTNARAKFLQHCYDGN